MPPKTASKRCTVCNATITRTTPGVGARGPLPDQCCREHRLMHREEIDRRQRLSHLGAEADPERALPHYDRLGYDPDEETGAHNPAANGYSALSPARLIDGLAGRESVALAREQAREARREADRVARWVAYLDEGPTEERPERRRRVARELSEWASLNPDTALRSARERAAAAERRIARTRELVDLAERQDRFAADLAENPQRRDFMVHRIAEHETLPEPSTGPFVLEVK